MAAQLQELKIGNFKAFGRTQTIPIRPITIVFGSNSAGKSSILHSLLYAHDAIRSGTDVFKPMPAHGAIDLGGYKQSCHLRNASNDIEIGFTFDFPLGSRQSSVTIESSLGMVHHYQSAVPKSFKISIDGSVLISSSIGKNTEYRSKEADTRRLLWMLFPKEINLSLIKERFAWASPKPPQRVLSNLDMTKTEYEVKVQEVLSLLKNHVAFGISDKLLPDSLVPVRKSHLADKKTRYVFEDITSNLKAFYLDICLAIENVFEEMCYLPALRTPPSRYLASYFADNTGTSGSLHWELIRNNDAAREVINSWLGQDFMNTPYRLQAENLYRESDIKRNLQETKLIGTLPSMSTDDIVRHRHLELVDVKKGIVVSTQDVGVGISQVIPVLVGGMGSHGNIFAVEQPESQLHPALAAEMGDLMVHVGFNLSSPCIVETHSEYLIRRILRRIRENSRKSFPDDPNEMLAPEDIPIDPDDVALLYVSPGETESHVTRLHISKDGRLIDPCPGGFFEEGIREMF